MQIYAPAIAQINNYNSNQYITVILWSESKTSPQTNADITMQVHPTS